MRALHVNYGLRGAESDADERHCAALCEELGVELEVVRASRAEGEAGNLQAWARDVRYGGGDRAGGGLDEREAAELDGCDARGLARGRSSRPGTRRATRSRRSSTGWRPRRAPRAAGDAGRARGGSCARCSASRASRPGRTASAGAALARGREQRRERYARARVRHGLGAALRAVHPAAEANVLRTASCCARRPSCSTASSRRRWQGARASRSRAWESWSGRSRAWSWCVSPSRRRARTCRRRAIASRRSSSWAGAAWRARRQARPACRRRECADRGRGPEHGEAPDAMTDSPHLHSLA